jgi:hypothetical protein
MDVVPEDEDGKSYVMAAPSYNRKPLLAFSRREESPERLPVQFAGRRPAPRV